MKNFKFTLTVKIKGDSGGIRESRLLANCLKDIAESLYKKGITEKGSLTGSDDYSYEWVVEESE